MVVPSGAKISMPVWPGWNPWLTPVFGGDTVIGQASFGTFLLVIVTLGAPVAVMNPDDELNVGASVDIDGGTGEPVPAFVGTGTGSLALAAVTVADPSGTGISRR